jgi:hypothetical protein
MTIRLLLVKKSNLFGIESVEIATTLPKFKLDLLAFKFQPFIIFFKKSGVNPIERPYPNS